METEPVFLLEQVQPGAWKPVFIGKLKPLLLLLPCATFGLESVDLVTKQFLSRDIGEFLLLKSKHFRILICVLLAGAHAVKTTFFRFSDTIL